MRIERRNTTEGQSPYAGIDFRLTTSEIRNPDGSVVFRLENVEVPTFWSQVASDVLAQKYFRKAGVAARLKKVEEETVPSWLWRSVPAGIPALYQRTLRQAGVRPPRRLLDLLGLEGQLLHFGRRRPRLL
jgi:ribonucleoside-diphosphate reductase alpha chain